MTPLLLGESLCLALSKIFKSIACQGSRVAHVVLHSTAAGLYDVASGTSFDDWWASFLGVARDVARGSMRGNGHWVSDRSAGIRRACKRGYFRYHQHQPCLTSSITTDAPREIPSSKVRERGCILRVLNSSDSVLCTTIGISISCQAHRRLILLCVLLAPTK